MDASQLNWIANFIWGIADDVLRDLYVRGKYRDVILPMTVLRRLDAVLEPTKQAVLAMKARLDAAGITQQDLALRQAAGRDFYNTSKFCLRDLKARKSQQQLRADFEAWLDGFSPNVQEIINNFEFRNQIPRLAKADALGTLIEKFLSPEINLSPEPVLNGDGRSNCPVWTTMPPAQSSRSWSAASTRRTTRRPANTGRPAMPSSSWPISSSSRSPSASSPARICSTTARAARAAC